MSDYKIQRSEEVDYDTENKPVSPLEDQARTRAVYDVYFVVED
jgi:hypothetical protein